ncbi:MAG: hypothetical protein DRJ98_08290 [Thermoprotei archaeon]|nr:MAG: hypothetical protein DRJ98_08290 [Thermoprotei archaeon]
MEIREKVLRWLETCPEPTLRFKPAWWERGEVIYENIYADGQYFGVRRFKNGAVYALVINKVSGVSLFRVPEDIIK